MTALHNCVILTYMSRLTDFGVCHCFKEESFVLMDSFETREIILGQILLSAPVAMHPCGLPCP